jgi:hypothetical protein
MVTNVTRSMITVIIVGMVAIGLALLVIDRPVVQVAKAPGDEQTSEDSSNTTTGISMSVPVDWRTFDAIADNVAFTLRHPAHTSIKAVRDAVFELTYVGPDSEEATLITDGYVVSIQLVEATSTLAYATYQDVVGEPVEVNRFGQLMLRYQSESALSGELITHYVRSLPFSDEQIADISVSTYGEQSSAYATEVDIILSSLTFTEVGSATGTPAERLTVTSPATGETVASPIMLVGEAPGDWFFEADAPVVVVNWDGLIIGESFVTAEDEWMTENLVPFSGTVEYEHTTDTYSATGTVIFQRANPSGLPEYDAAVEVPVQLVPTDEASATSLP